MSRGLRPACVLAGWVILASGLFGCDDDIGKPRTGHLSVLVTDYALGPVSDQEISVVPGGWTARTTAQGIALFELKPGPYFVDAELCCVGPGLIHYHEPVAVAAGDTARVTLHSCLGCD